MDNQQCTTMPRIGDKAPAFSANTTQGKIEFPQDFEGKWVILFSHPSDFTPVCTSEFMMFGKMARQFEDLNCQLLGLSVDGLSSHIAWLRTIREKIEFKGMKDMDIQFPLIDDLSMKIANMYGMIQPGESETKAVRAVFFIDPKGMIRAIIYYPLSLGRNFDELKRVLIGLQTCDNYSVSLPADWQPGDDVVVPAPATMGGAQERINEKKEGQHCCDWFFTLRKLSKEDVESRLGKTKETK